MEKGKTLKENISWLLQQYKKGLSEEEKKTAKEIMEENIDIRDIYENIICELEFALEISK